MTKERKSVSLKPSTFVKEFLHEQTFEQALERGRILSNDLADKEWAETSIRFSVGGLYSWYSAYADSRQLGSVFKLLRDSTWMWLSYCENNDIIKKTENSYFKLLRFLTENTSHTDLTDRMNEVRYVRMGRAGRPFHILIPRNTQSYLQRCALSLGIPFSTLLQAGFGWCLSRNRDGLYAKWVRDTVEPLLAEITTIAQKRLDDFDEIEYSARLREMKSGNALEDAQKVFFSPRDLDV